MSDARARANNTITAGSRHRPIAAQTLWYVLALLIVVSLAALPEAVGLVVVCVVGRYSQGRGDTRRGGRPKPRRRAVAWLSADQADVGDAEPTAKEDQIDPMAQHRCRIEKVFGLVGGEAGIRRVLALPGVGEPGADDGLIGRG